MRYKVKRVCPLQSTLRGNPERDDGNGNPAREEPSKRRAEILMRGVSIIQVLGDSFGCVAARDQKRDQTNENENKKKTNTSGTKIPQKGGAP